MQTSIAIFVTSLLVQCSIAVSNKNSSDFIIPASTSIKIEDYSNKFWWRLKSYTIQSVLTAETVVTSVQELSKNISRDMQDFKNSRLESESLKRVLNRLELYFNGTSSRFEEAILRYKNYWYEESDSKDEVLAFAQRMVYGYDLGGRIFISIIEDHLDDIKTKYDVCKMGKSQQQLFYVLLKNFQYATAQSYSTFEITHELLEKFNIQDQTKDHLKIYQSEGLKVYRLIASAFKDYLDKLSREFYVCDANDKVSGNPGSLLQLQAFQKYVFTEDQISPGFPGQDDRCEKQCTSVNEVNKLTSNPKDFENILQCNRGYRGNQNHNYELCVDRRKCNKLHCPDEQDLEISAGKLEVCVSGPYYSTKRYEYYRKSEDSSSSINCPGQIQTLDSTSRGNRYFGSLCHICECTCIENEYYISTQQFLTDVSNNMVVVGAKFVLLKNTLYIQLQEGQLLPNGSIDASTVAWKPVHERSSDRVKIDWEGLRGIDLTDTIIPEGNALTGLKFDEIHDTNAKDEFKQRRVSLSVHSTQYDFVKGELIRDSKWHSANITKYDRERTLLEGRPARNPANRRITINNEFVTFVTSSPLLDGGQSTVPFIDGEEVTPGILTPLSGAGLLYIGQEGFGGFVGLKFITYETATHINTE